MIWQPRIIVVALIIAVLSLFCAVQTARLAGERADHSATKAQHAERMAALERAGREAEQSARAEERRRADALQGVIDETEQKLAAARADADAAADVGRRLRAQIGALAGRCRAAPGDTALASAGAPADATSDLLADVQRRLDDATDGIARFADQAHAAGSACERSYRALAADTAPLDR